MDNKLKVIWSDGKEYMRQPCEIHTRCMGYYAAVTLFNKGKKSEMYSRKYFKTPNKEFLEQFA